jgi:hypothetical protein
MINMDQFIMAGLIGAIEDIVERMEVKDAKA